MTHLVKQSELIALIDSAEKVRFGEVLAYKIKNPADLPTGQITKHELPVSPYVQTTISAAHTYIFALDFLVDGKWLLGKDLEAEYGVSLK